jgi:hypothetical protein
MLKHKSFINFCVALAAALGSTSVLLADVTFTDTTFDLSNYSIMTFQSGGGVISVSQTLTGGDPGAAMQINTTVPAGQFLALEYFLNPSFSYSPNVQGVISTIAFSQDVNFQSGIGVAVEAAFSLISQGGNLYVDRIDVPAAAGVFVTASASGLQASDYDLVTNLDTFTQNPTAHPNFAGASMEFGFMGAWSNQATFPAYTEQEVLDNLSITVNTMAVPEPSSLLPCGILLAICSLGLRLSGRRPPFRFR